MKRSVLIVTTMILVICILSKFTFANSSKFKNELYELCKDHYLFDYISDDLMNSNHSSILLKSKLWNNPKDTKKLVESIKTLAEKSAPDKFRISIFGKPSETNIVALITVNPKGVVLTYAYSKAKQEFLSSKKSSWEKKNTINVRGRSITIGLHADVVFEILTKADKISESDVDNDGDGNLIVTHHWKVDNKLIDITFTRSQGMYRAQNIRVMEAGKSKNVQKVENLRPKKKVTERPMSCHIYDDCKMYGGCKDYSNCYSACFDDCKRNNCPLCK